MKCTWCLLLACVAAAQPGPVRIFEDVAGALTEHTVLLAAGERVVFETVALSPGADPVLHLFDKDANRELAFDDNGAGGKAARLSFVAPRNMFVSLLVRERGVLSKGTCDLLKNGQPFKQGVRFDGWLHPLLNLEFNEEIHVISPPAGPRAHSFYVLSEDGLRITHRVHASGVHTRFVIPFGFGPFRNFLMGTTELHAHRKLRLIRNDGRLPGRDPDGDGLGAQLEGQLKTCSARTDSYDAFLCSTVADLRDTDGDGVPDGWEVLGRDFRDPADGRITHVPLPHMGADPRHKDLFIEVDYRRLTKRENDLDERHKMPPQVARAFAAAYGDAATTHPLVEASHGRLLNNPDLKKGIRVHLDTGVEPETDADAAIYGNWGGYNTINAVRKGNKFDGPPPGALWRTNMHPSRFGIFKYGPGHISGGGQCGRGVACGYNMRSASNAIHEMGHSFGLNHTGPMDFPQPGVNCAPNYPSVMSYAFMGKGEFADGQNRAALNNTALAEFKAVSPGNKAYLDDLVNTFGYTVDRVNGHVDWNRDGQFAGPGETVRAYANYGAGLECEFTRMNKVTVPSARTNSSLALARFSGKTYLFFVDPAGTVRFSTSTSNWKCAAAEAGCDGSGWSSPTSAAFPVKAVGVDADTTSFFGLSYLAIAVTAQDGTLWHRIAFRQPNGVEFWRGAEQIPSAPVAGEPSLAGIRSGTGLFLAYKGADNRVRWRTYDGHNWSAETVALATNGKEIVTSADASPAIANVYLPFKVPGQPMIYGAFAATDGRLRMMWLDFGGRWVNTGLLDNDLMPVKGRPTMAWVPASTAADFPGTFYLGARSGADGDYMTARTYVNAKGTPRIGIASFFDNSFLEGAAFDFLSGDTTGTPQLWAALSFKNGIEFRPRADGIVDLTYRNYDDWSVLGWGLCFFTVDPLRQDPKPIRCPNRPF